MWFDRKQKREAGAGSREPAELSLLGLFPFTLNVFFLLKWTRRVYFCPVIHSRSPELMQTTGLHSNRIHTKAPNVRREAPSPLTLLDQRYNHSRATVEAPNRIRYKTTTLSNYFTKAFYLLDSF